jgi:hypothetical protein
MLVINQPDAVSNIAVPMFYTRVILHRTVKAKWLKGPQRDVAGPEGVEAMAECSGKWVVNAPAQLHPTM